MSQEKPEHRNNQLEDEPGEAGEPDNAEENEGNQLRREGGLEESGEQQQKNERRRGEEEPKQAEDRLQASKVTVSKGAKQQLWKAYDFLFPGGKLAKLIKVHNIYKKSLPIRDMLQKFKYNERLPVVNLIGAMEKGRGKFYAGIVRAAFNTDAVIVDNGLVSGIEKFALRRGVKLVGIAPEGEIKFPKINPTQPDPMELANGHTHLFLVNNPTKDLHWGGEVAFKIDVCLNIASGKNLPKGLDRCKIVSILLGDATFDMVQEIKLSVENEIPIIIVPGSGLSDEIIKCTEGKGRPELEKLIEKGHFFYCNSNNSEDIAQLTHIMLSISPW